MTPTARRRAPLPALLTTVLLTAFLTVALLAPGLPAAGAPAVGTGTGTAIEVAPPAPPDPDPAALAALPRAPAALPGLAPLGACPAGIAPAGFDALLPEPAAVPGASGTGVLVAVVDSGVAPHPRLTGGVADGGDFVAGRSARTDCDGHGTAVAGVVAAAPGPDDDGVVGVAPGARVLSVRADTAWSRTAAGPAGDESVLARAVRAAVATPDVRVLTLALAACRPAAGLVGGAGAPLGALRAAVREAVARDVVVVAAAGNVGSACPANDPATAAQRVSTVPVPAWFGLDPSEVLTVGALDDDGAPDRASLAGPWVGIAAPGRVPAALDARSAGLTADLTLPGSAPAPVVGTSFAAARVAGAAVLLRARFPTMPTADVVARLRATAAPVPGAASTAVGAGALDVTAALSGARPAPPPAATAPAPSSDGTGWALVAAGGVLVAVALAALVVRRRRRA
ncbi:S8 family serine peptidase [Actinomycetospora soli]|uniref:S8 family serine peptidase n=1 Tax=Actinomycetospora soli TaxID=2893887 RepID=UPI001E447BCC|nr:S8 family serine peptidase [Actinomycetospora soli]MCD2189434.1 S8 family serine peptidase [Actinomycetospora soli]